VVAKAISDKKKERRSEVWPELFRVLQLAMTIKTGTERQYNRIRERASMPLLNNSKNIFELVIYIYYSFLLAGFFVYIHQY
jgi:hypothetical protein